MLPEKLGQPEVTVGLLLVHIQVLIRDRTYKIMLVFLVDKISDIDRHPGG